MHTVKNIITKAKADGSNPLLLMLGWHTTPVNDIASPAQLLMGRQLRSILPATNHLLKPTTINPADIVSRRRQLQATQKRYYDQTAHPLPPWKTGDKIYTQLSQGDDWRPAKVIAPSSQPQSYTIQTADTHTFRRNRRFLRRSTAQGSTPQDDPLWLTRLKIPTN